MWLWRQIRARPPEVAWRSWFRLVFNVWKRGVARPFTRSLVGFAIGVSRRWLWLVPGVALGLLSLLEKGRGEEVTVEPWLVWLVIGIGFGVAALAEYHSVRVSRERLAEDRKTKLNGHLSEGLRIRERLRQKEAGSVLQAAGWVLTAERLIQNLAPAFYEWWEADVPADLPLETRFREGIGVLTRVCRELERGS